MPDTDRLFWALAVLLAWLAFCAATAWRARSRARARRAAAGGGPTAGGGGPIAGDGGPIAGDGGPIAGDGGPAEYLVVHASQTGFAEQLAARTADALRSGGLAVRAARIDALTGRHLAGGRVLFLASTAGEGDAPDDAAVFVRKVMGGAADLSSLRYGLLALGDSSYINYCAFGRRLDAWLRERGATPLFPRVEVDDGDAAALRQWDAHLGSLAGRALAPAWSPPRHEGWRLAERRRLNPGSPGGPAFHIALAPPAALPAWQAGDIAEVMPRNAPDAVQAVLAALGLDPARPVHAEDGSTLAEVLAARRLPEDAAGLAGLPVPALIEALPRLPHRDYSIASLPADGALHLLVREMRHPDGRLGLGSGWLTAHVPEGGTVDLRIRANAGFHPPADGRPMILIGNGTGLAGLRAHLKAREAAGHRRNWLIFGERTRAADFFHRAEIEAWTASGLIARCDLAFSRDQAERIYVQHLLADARRAVRDWVEEGAAVYVCGSQAGMATAVHAALTEILGEDGLAALAEAGRYRRDVY